ncbi:MAG: dihydroorotate dehydrogenase electron transfer subunit [Prevotellaceae bacterium]|jgi:dihydroorotate dehydrogenase electron transfer subunit|nr:dihydroorotate dehydrogenase electron transfer subunit [Prevotellaceae bacterium]
MKKFMLDLTVKENIPLENRYFLLKLTSNDRLPEMLPGQFAEVRVDDAPTVFLRRPVSIHYVDYVNNELWLLIQIVGGGTRKLSGLRAGNTLNLLFPLGNTFKLDTGKNSRIMLIGGGAGIAPLLFLGAYLKERGCQCNFLLGARTKKDLLQLHEFEKYGEVYTTTEDASHGEKGYVTQHSILNGTHFDIIYTCGPTPMMKAVAQYAEAGDIYCEASLENTMACGIGACLCCVTDTKDEGHVCVCTGGPVFNTKRLKW